MKSLLVRQLTPKLLPTMLATDWGMELTLLAADLIMMQRTTVLDWEPTPKDASNLVKTKLQITDPEITVIVMAVLLVPKALYLLALSARSTVSFPVTVTYCFALLVLTAQSLVAEGSPLLLLLLRNVLVVSLVDEAPVSVSRSSEYLTLVARQNWDSEVVVLGLGRSIRWPNTIGEYNTPSAFDGSANESL